MGIGSAVIGALRVNLSIDTAEFRSGLNSVRASLMSVGKNMASIGKNMTLGISTPLAAMGVGVLKTAGDFEASMNRVQAASGASSEQFKAMQAMALKLGADTSKSASEAADGMEMLAKNGVSADDILGGAAAASIKLSIATGGDLSQAADVATNAMSQFNKKAGELGKVADDITGVTLQSQFGFEDYALALGQAGGVAGAIGVSFDDFNATIAATSSVFNSGSDAGTSFKTFLTSLNPKSKEAASTMEELKLSFYNADGSMKSMAAVAQELKDKMSGLSQQDLSSKMNSMFGVDGMRTAIALMQQGGAGIEAMNAKILAASADDQASARMKGFNGQLEQLTGALETLSITIANSGLLEFVTGLLQRLADLVSNLSTTNPEILKWGTVVAGLAIVIGPVVAALGLLVVGITAIGGPVLLAVTGVTALTAAVVAFWPQIQQAATAVSQFVSGAWATFVVAWDQIPIKVATAWQSVQQFAANIVSAFAAIPGQMIEIGGQIIDGLWQGIQAKWESLKGNVTGIASSIKSSFTNFFDIHSPSKVMHDVGTFVMQGLGNGMESMRGGVEGTASSIASTVSSAFEGLIDGSKKVKDVLKDLAMQIGKSALNSGVNSLLSAFGIGGGGSAFKATTTIGNFLQGIPGFATGGSILPGGLGGIDSQLMMFKKSPTEQVDIYDPRKMRSGGGGSFRGGDLVVQGDVSERNRALILAAIRDNNKQLAYARENEWRS